MGFWEHKYWGLNSQILCHLWTKFEVNYKMSWSHFILTQTSNITNASSVVIRWDLSVQLTHSFLLPLIMMCLDLDFKSSLYHFKTRPSRSLFRQILIFGRLSSKSPEDQTRTVLSLPESLRQVWSSTAPNIYTENCVLRQLRSHLLLFMTKHLTVVIGHQQYGSEEVR